MTRRPISAKTRYVILERDRFTCQCCGGTAPNVTLHVDHIVAVANGGSDDLSNLRAVCVTCNIGKGALEPNVISAGVSIKYPIRISDNEVKIRGDALSEPIFWIGNQWAVTAYGIECRDGTYVIEAQRLWEDEGGGHGWAFHMKEKVWVDYHDFVAAITWARQHFAYLRNAKQA